VQPDQSGVIDIEIVSSNAPNKRPDPQSEDGLAQIRSMLDELEGEFILDVARGRGVTSARVKSDFGRGGVLVGRSSVSAGMADMVETQAIAISSARQSVGRGSDLRSRGAVRTHHSEAEMLATLRRLRRSR
jgi:ClpP class serine protease